MSETIPLFLLEVLGFAGFLWLGFYALIRGNRGAVATLLGMTALATACFFGETGLLAPLRNPPGTPFTGGAASVWINRVFWWDNVAPIALWLHLSVCLNPRAAHASWRRPVLVASYSVGVALIGLGMIDGVLRHFSSTGVSARPAFVLFVIYLFACTSFAVLNFAQLRPRDTGVSTWPARPDGTATTSTGPDTGSSAGAASAWIDPSQVRLLVIGAILFLLGAGYLALRVLLGFTGYTTPGYVLLLAGLGAVGTAVAIRGGLLLGKDVRRDYIYSFTGLLALLAPFLVVTGLLIGFDDKDHAVFALVLTALITAAHTLNDVGREWLDRAFFPPVVREERAAARAYAEALATQPAGAHPDLATAKAFDDAVRRALTHLSDPTRLATSPLLNLAVVARAVAESGEDNRLNRVAALREILLDLLDGLKPSDEAGRVTSDAWRYYNCLYYPYVRGIGRRRAPAALRQVSERRRREGIAKKGDFEQMLEWLLNLDENTFYKWQRRGSDTIAAALREREAAAGGAVPAPDPARVPIVAISGT